MDPKSDENCESIPMALTREPASVPNFRTLQKSSSLDEEEEARQQKKVTAQALEKATALMEEAAVAAASQNGKQVAAAAAFRTDDEGSGEIVVGCDVESPSAVVAARDCEVSGV